MNTFKNYPISIFKGRCHFFNHRSISITIWICFLFHLTSFVLCIAQTNENQVLSILLRFAKDYEKDVTFKSDETFGVKVDEDFWTIVAKAGDEENIGIVTVSKGSPQDPTFYFTTNFETLKKIDERKWNVMTAGANEDSPFDVKVMDGFQPGDEFLDKIFGLYFHFWTRGNPEIIPFGLEYTRLAHGAQTSIFYYQSGFRSIYFAIKKGQKTNDAEEDESNPFPSLIVFIKGKGEAVVGGKKVVVQAGQAILIPAGVTHKFTNLDSDLPLEGILLMFGKGA